MATRVAIVGGGWYGCHIALSLLALGFEVRLFEQHGRLLHEASGNNQFRLHLGFHYARHHGTRVQSRDGYTRFMERYAMLSREIAENIYAVPREDSLIDWQTYKLIMSSTGLNYSEVSSTSHGLQYMDGVMLVDERVLLTERARKYFTKALTEVLVLNYPVTSIVEADNCIIVEGESYDYLIDATWGHQERLPFPLFYEPTILLYYEGVAGLPAVTMVDGPLCSVYPTEDSNIYTLSSVPFTPIGQYKSSAEARAVRDSIGGAFVNQKIEQMEDQIIHYMPDFKEKYRFLAPQLSIKTKPTGKFDDRSCGVYRRGRIFSVMSGKIDTIFFAVERILSLIQVISDHVDPAEVSALRRDVIIARASVN